VWRRGTVPLWWGQEIKSTVGEAEIYIHEDPFNGVAKYYQRLQQRYAKVPPQPAADATSAVADEASASASDSSESTPPPKPRKPECVFTMINLLRCAPGKPEVLLSEMFQESLRLVRKDNAELDVRLLNFDWHSNVKSLGEEKAVEGLWEKIRPTITQVRTCSCLAGSW
jgi:hypothetical protein